MTGQPTPGRLELIEACTAWQDGRDGGSSPIRAAARILTGTKHYFEADFITAHERRASEDPATMNRARVLLDELSTSPLHSAEDWGALTGFPTIWAGRGIKSAAQDAQIDEAIRFGELAMPLWGASLDPDIARSFMRDVTRSSRQGYLFELIGAFPAIPASAHSNGKHEEQELICGGRYAVAGIRRDDAGTTVVQLRFTAPIASRARQ